MYDFVNLNIFSAGHFLSFRVVASMGQGEAIPPPRFECCPPDEFLPYHGRKPAFGNGAIAYQDFSLKPRESVKISNFTKISQVFLKFSKYMLNFSNIFEILSKISLIF